MWQFWLTVWELEGVCVRAATLDDQKLSVRGWSGKENSLVIEKLGGGMAGGYIRGVAGCNTRRKRNGTIVSVFRPSVSYRSGFPQNETPPGPTCTRREVRRSHTYARAVHIKLGGSRERGAKSSREGGSGTLSPFFSLRPSPFVLCCSPFA